MIAGLLAAAALLVADPSGDAHGAGDLVPPTAEVYSSSSPFDLVEVEVLEGSTLTLRVRLGERPNPGDLPNGVTLPVIDLYLDTEPGGREELLPGPGLRMPADAGWEVAVRVTGDAAFARRASDPAATDHPVTVTPEEDALRIATPFEAPEEARIQAVTGVYDPFDPDGWRPLTREPSPWAFSSATAATPVVDVLAEDDVAQRAALRSGVLPVARSRAPAAPWLVLMVLGVAIAVAGLVLRGRVANEGAAAEDGASEGDAPAAASPLESDVGTDTSGAEDDAAAGAEVGAPEGAAAAPPASDDGPPPAPPEPNDPEEADATPPLLAADDLFDPPSSDPSAPRAPADAAEAAPGEEPDEGGREEGNEPPVEEAASAPRETPPAPAEDAEAPADRGDGVPPATAGDTETPPAEELPGDEDRREDAGRTEGTGGS